MIRPIPRQWGWLAGGLLGVGLIAVPIARGIGNLVQTRGAVATYAHLVAAANAGDLTAVRDLCSRRYRALHPPEPARGGGVVGFPRQIHPNFRVWVQGPEVWLCPANRVGMVYRFVWEAAGWRYDGPVGILGAGGYIAPLKEEPGLSGEIP